MRFFPHLGISGVKRLKTNALRWGFSSPSLPHILPMGRMDRKRTRAGMNMAKTRSEEGWPTGVFYYQGKPPPMQESKTGVWGIRAFDFRENLKTFLSELSRIQAHPEIARSSVHSPGPNSTLSSISSHVSRMSSLVTLNSILSASSLTLLARTRFTKNCVPPRAVTA